jgi:hypothetical protein
VLDHRQNKIRVFGLDDVLLDNTGIGKGFNRSTTALITRTGSFIETSSSKLGGNNDS